MWEYKTPSDYFLKYVFVPLFLKEGKHSVYLEYASPKENLHMCLKNYCFLTYLKASNPQLIITKVKAFFWDYVNDCKC